MLWILLDTLNAIPKLCHYTLPHKSGPSYLYKNPPKVYGEDTHEEDPIVTEDDKMTEPGTRGVVIITTWLGTVFTSSRLIPSCWCGICIKVLRAHCVLTSFDAPIACLSLGEQGECPFWSDGSWGMAGTATHQLNGTEPLHVGVNGN